MPATLTVLVVTHDPGHDLADLVASWDAQSAGRETADLVVVDDGSGDGSADRWHQLAGRRPNVTVLDGAGDVAGTVARALRDARGAYVLRLRQEQRLARRAVELLVREADRTGADVVLGRASSAAGSGSVGLPDDVERLDPGAVAAALTSGAPAVRRELLLAQEDPAAALEDPEALLTTTGASVAALGSAAVLVTPGTAEPSSAALTDVRAEWRDGRLEITGVLPGDRTTTRAWLALTPAQGWGEHTVPATVDGERVTAVLDQRTAGSGDPLEDGTWDLSLRAAGADGEVALPLPKVRVTPAVLEGRPFVVGAGAHGLQLDVGATRTSALGAVQPDDAEVEETSAGSRMTLRYPGVHVVDDAVVPVRVRLGDLVVPASLVCRDGLAMVEGFVTGLAGAVPVAVGTGSTRPRGTGLQLVVDAVGGMTLQPEPAKPAPAPSRSAPEPEPQRPAPSPSLAQRVRRRVPDRLEPAVRRLADVPVLASAYRRLLRG